MEIFVALAVYIIGVWIAHFQIRRWTGQDIIEEDDENQMFFALSTLAWLVYPLYWLLWLYRKTKEG